MTQISTDLVSTFGTRPGASSANKESAGYQITLGAAENYRHTSSI